MDDGLSGVRFVLLRLGGRDVFITHLKLSESKKYLSWG